LSTPDFCLADFGGGIVVDCSRLCAESENSAEAIDGVAKGDDRDAAAFGFFRFAPEFGKGLR
jgi:hypothetical protein